MAGESREAALLRDVQTLFGLGVAGGLTDGRLLEQFLTADDVAAEAAFTTLVERHGAMVLHVCRQTLDDPHDAQDAFQATFLVFLRRAGSIRKRESVASWLFGVALRVARRRAMRWSRGGSTNGRVASSRPFDRTPRVSCPNAWRRCMRRSRGCRSVTGSRSCSAILRACQRPSRPSGSAVPTGRSFPAWLVRENACAGD